MQLAELDKPETVEHLLSWLNSTVSELSPVFTLEQLIKTGHIANTLIEVDAEVFKPLTEGECDIQRQLGLLQRFLENDLGKTIKRRFRLELVQKSNYAMLLGVVLFTCVHCVKKERHIKNILEESASTQTCLMRVIELMDRNIENIMEIREILEKVEELELENESLRDQLRLENGRNGDLAQRLEIIMADYKSLEEECDALKNDKLEVLKQLNISTMGEYIQLFKNVQRENIQLGRSLDTSERKNIELAKDKLNYKAKIVEDSQLISDLNEELGRLKGVCRSLRLSNSLSQIELQPFDTQDYLSMSVDGNVLKENKLLCNRQRSAEEHTDTTKKIATTMDDDEAFDAESFLRLQYEYKQTVFKCEKLQQASECQKGTIQNYEQTNERLRRYNDFLQNKMQELKAIHCDLTKAMSTPRTSYRC